MGIILPESSFRDYWRNAAKNSAGYNTFDTLYTGVGLAEQQSLQNITYDYGKAVNEAYKTYHNQLTDINASNLGQGFKERERESLNISLEDAYKKYQQTYLSDVSNIENVATQYRNEISSAIDTQAMYTNKLYNSTYDYLSYLYETNHDMFKQGNDRDFWYNLLTADLSDEETSTLLNNVPGFTEKLRQEKIKSGEGRLMTQEELNSMLYDEEGNLTLKGTDYFDKLINSGSYATGEFLDYDTWLYNQSQVEKGDYEGLYDWYNSYNPYDVSLDEYGLPTNKAFIRTAFGMVSSDNAYQFAERWGGFTEDELRSYYDKYYQKVSQISEKIEKSGKDKPDVAIDDIKDLTKELRQLAFDFGIEDDLYDMFNEVDKKLDQYKSETIPQGKMAEVFFEQVGVEAAMMAGAAAAGTKNNSNVSTGAAAVFGAIAGAIVGMFTSGSYIDAARTTNKEKALSAKQSFNEILAAMINLSMSKRKEAEIEWKKNKY